MHALTEAQAKAIYRQAIDATARDDEGAAWWSDVQAEIGQVVASRTIAAGGKVIEWWHHDWAAVGDSPKAAARRIREATRTAALADRGRAAA